jgi:hypothetical protein
MNSTLRNIILAVIGVFVGLWLLRMVVGVALGLIFGYIVPLAIVVGVVYGCYLLFGRKALGGGRRYLP